MRRAPRRLATAKARSKPRIVNRGPYSRSDGSLADSVVRTITVIRTTRAVGQKVAGAYAGALNIFEGAGFSCNSAAQLSVVGDITDCKKGKGHVSYKTTIPTDCSATPGILNSAKTGQPVSGPSVFTWTARPR